jgi:hypothetical protein
MGSGGAGSVARGTPADGADDERRLHPDGTFERNGMEGKADAMIMSAGVRVRPGTPRCYGSLPGARSSGPASIALAPHAEHGIAALAGTGPGK